MRRRHSARRWVTTARLVSWNGTAWSTDASGTLKDLWGVSCVTTTLCKAVGDDGTIVSWNGTAWSANTSGTS